MAHSQLTSRQRGFTLVEIAVVLVIIGLLLGGVLKGQELINSAKVKSLINDFRNVATFAYAYQDRFRALPGDDAGAASHLSGGVKASTGGTAGNGRIEGNWNSTTATDESVLFWQHVRLANLASGDGRNPGLEGLVILDWLPRNAAGGRTGITGVAPITGWAGNFFVCQDNIPGSLARQVDIAMDDGQPAAGSVRLLANGSASGSAVALADLADGTPYTVCAAL
ncbi:MAG TPA: prepilin-type N-terminal cleavage/methylation domain-containing protein [Rhodocyclaceae bacterium]|uniref:prepilin-type N-terminal cleavage/methylation domain-containing protein n=1 Tax=Zoogloea sp. TaxID=49181 RepID=UPI002C33C839|nr:prepilin-type N-terminal cleavage/methylation domain-containing protein [Zoogloea sp.]HMV62213.1 prepilin-type N-terminal cleavage/methylation domain-containing protein [Rhodocyclaceae bacterium]HMW52259.1 prepilin-type N-terminal cleavage/methylation domain-containing protein [Rhodocyclaceae bacterium]HNA67190.1 prepilin-type N-terminal cleavage/methylation domain-containing protein [Rhodocyclaceae bacterium]HNB65894.1 prepilin-type N-terminal cleavage/methylation domain-containing protein 